jgi:hypothetical protein
MVCLINFADLYFEGARLHDIVLLDITRCPTFI